MVSRTQSNIEERRWALKLVLAFSRDNPDLKGQILHYRYSHFFLPVKMFADYHEVPLTTTDHLFPNRTRRKYLSKPFTADFIRRLLGLLSQRDRAVCMMQLQSGQSLKQILVDANSHGKEVMRQVEAGANRIRLDFPERKGNGFRFFSFISVDAIQEVKKWLPIRDQWLKTLGLDSEWLFITRTGKPLRCDEFHNNFRLLMKRHKLYDLPYSVPRHGFRKFFEQEASPPDRGISRAYVSFMMGHSQGDGSGHVLDAVGGVYDHAPEVYPEAVEKEYAKLEPYLNIYSNKAVDSPRSEALNMLADLLEASPERMRRFKEFVASL